MERFIVKNFGCRASQADGAALEAGLAAKGLLATGDVSEADLVVLNTCTVTATADDEVRQTVRRIHRAHPDARILVTGCYAQRAPDELAALGGVSLVVGNSHKTRIPDMVAGAIPYHGQIQVGDIFESREFLSAPVDDALGDRTRPNLKIQDGCNNRCSFCIIPFVRGRSRSAPAEEVIRQVARLAAKYREVVLSGINLGRWGRDLPIQSATENWELTTDNCSSELRLRAQPLHFEDLIRAILSETSLEKLRISSVEPMDWSDELIRMMAGSPRIAKHAHVPLQSGSDRVLRAMHRKYRPWHYREKVEKIRAAMPTAAIGADVMVGFPGESESDFEETRLLIEELSFTYLHVFTYSPRPGTPAAAMRDQVPAQVARERNRILRELAAEKKLAFMRTFVGKTVDAISLNVFDGQSTEALTDNYLKLRLAGHHEPNRWLQARVGNVADGALVATL